MAQFVTAFGALWLVVGVVVFIAFSFVLPLSVFLAMRNLRQIRMQLERFNDNIESGRAGVGPLR
jgi:hypothetical protein